MTCRTTQVQTLEDSGSLSGSSLVWSNVKLGAGETKDFTFRAIVKDDTANNYVLRNKVIAKSEDHDLTAEASDTTLVKRAPVVAAATTVAPVSVPVTAKTGAEGAAAAVVATLSGAAGLIATIRKANK